MIGRVILLFTLLSALSTPLLLQFCRTNRITKGTFPLFTEGKWKFTHDMIPNLAGKTIIVTGANVGLGKSTAKILALHGAEVILACRSKSKCDEAAGEIKQIKKDAKVESMVLDLQSLASVKSFANEFNKKHNKLDSLILNAGIMHPPFALTTDGIESQFGVNHVAHFYLTQLVTPALERAQPSTVVSVSSNGQFHSHSEGVYLTLDGINNASNYNPIRAYGQSKLSNVLFAQELAERFRKAGKKIFVNSLNPGGVNTELLREYPETFTKVFKYIVGKFPDTIFWEPDTAALTQIYCAISPEIVEKEITGKYFVPIAELCDTSDFAKNSTLQKQLWTFSEKLLKDRGFNWTS